MALPVILFNSSSGSDSTASGAGPATPLFGTNNASTNAAGTVVTLGGGPDLSGVATDGSAVLFFNDATAGNRNFGKITAKDNVAKTVTVSNAFGSLITNKSWAIGGKRATLGGTTSAKLTTNNAVAGDAMPGWILEMQSGYTETLAATLGLARSGDTADGPITLRGEASAATRPILTFSNNGVALATGSDFIVFKSFDVKNSNATKTASQGIQIQNGADGVRIEDVKIADSGNKFWKAILTNASSSGMIIGCNIGSTASDGITCAATSWMVHSCYIHDCTGNGITLTGSATRTSFTIVGNIIYSCSDGINRSSTLAAGDSLIIDRNTIDHCADGVEIASAPGTSMTGWSITNNILSNGSGYGLNFSSGSATAAALNAVALVVTNNDTYNNATAAYNPAGYGASDPAVNPSFTSAAGGDFTTAVTSLYGAGYPQASTQGNIGRGSITPTYLDIGAAQRANSVTGSSGAVFCRHFYMHQVMPW